MNLNQAKSILAEAQQDLHAAHQAQSQARAQIESARNRVNSVLGSGIQMAGLKEAQGWLAGLSDAAEQALPRIHAAHQKIGQASGS
jgi:outer membrane protein TolC